MLGSGQQFAMRKSIKGQQPLPPFRTKEKVRSHAGEREDASGACAGEAARCVCGRGSAPAGEATPSAVRVTLKSVAATRAQWQRDLGGEQDLVQFACCGGES